MDTDYVWTNLVIEDAALYGERCARQGLELGIKEACSVAGLSIHGRQLYTRSSTGTYPIG